MIFQEKQKINKAWSTEKVFHSLRNVQFIVHFEFLSRYDLPPTYLNEVKD